MEFHSDVEAVDALVSKYNSLKNEIATVIVGQDEVIKNLLISVFCKGHCLLVGVPGLAKTLMVNTLSKTLGLSYNRIQFTPDLMPSDIIGTEILDENRHFRFIRGPVFAQVILADEINRTPPKTQSALLEAMQEKAVTVAGTTYHLEEPFFVLATQNPIEQEGTYPLPEAQLDRFMFNVWLDYPAFGEEIQIVKSTTTEKTVQPKVILNAAEILFYQNLIRKVPVPDNVYHYAVELVSKTRPGAAKAHPWAREYLTWGAGPRASQYLILGAKCHAVLQGKYSPDIADVKAIAISVLRHRIVLNYKAEAEGKTVEHIIHQLLA
ncbi:MAG: AAA family ATPase [Bacteroidales bacterium]|nr:AAA family ATPase [Bacteroidales bacterium]HNW73618.1 AAA family ATPase [Bacteroidales bacterium]HPS50189.1 AAA family ATPase [Bacteroidales bacterium]